MVLSDTGINLPKWKEELDAKSVPADLERFVEHIRVDYLPHTVIIDCTADEASGSQVPGMARSRHPHRHAEQEGEQRRSRRTTAACTTPVVSSGAHYLYETTVGAGLPVVQTLRDLRDTGDEITSIEGIFSGTLAYLFNVYDGKTAFSDIVNDAKQRGYTEPDPRDDLSGTDVARKLIILGREAGMALQMSDVKVESLVPAGLEQGSIEDFLGKLPQYDGTMRDRYETAKASGKVLRYVGRLTADGKATVGVVELDQKHAFANIALTDNVVRFATRRYCNNPLIVQGRAPALK